MQLMTRIFILFFYFFFFYSFLFLNFFQKKKNYRLCGRPFGFNVVSVGYNPKKDEAGLHLFVCENDDEKLEWVRCLRAHDATSHFEQGKKQRKK